MPRYVLNLLLACGLLTSAVAQDQPKPKQENPIPVISGDLGDCTADFTVTNSKLKPLYAAKISVQLKYGFAGLHRTDLEVSTNVDGKARFEGLPTRGRRTLGFTVTYQGRSTAVVVDPDQQCHGSYSAIVTDKPVKADEDTE